MRLGFFCHSLSGVGPRVRTRTTIAALADQTAHQPVLVTGQNTTFSHNGVEIHRIGAFRRYTSPSTALTIRRILTGCDVVHVPVNALQLLYVATLGVGPLVAGPGIQHETPYRYLVRLLGIEKMVETHEFTAYLWEKTGVDAVPIYPAVDTDLFRPLTEERCEAFREELGIPDTESVVLFVGTLRPAKGADIVSQLPDHFGDEVTVVVVGDGPRREAFTGRDDLVYEGFVENEDLPAYYAMADVTVVPSVDESFSIVSLESAACGTPVVTTSSEDSIMYRLFHDRGSYIWTERTPAGIAEEVRQLLADEQRYDHHVQRGFDTIDEMGLSIDDTIEKYLEVYRDAAGGG